MRKKEKDSWEQWKKERYKQWTSAQWKQHKKDLKAYKKELIKFGTKDNPYNLIAGTEFYAVLVEAGIADSNKKVDLVCIKDCWFKIVSTEFVDKEKAYIANYATCETIECKIEPYNESKTTCNMFLYANPGNGKFNEIYMPKLNKKD